MVGRYKRQTVRSDEEAAMLGQSCETGGLGEDASLAVQSHPKNRRRKANLLVMDWLTELCRT